MGKYLFVFFTGEENAGEQVYFSDSEDGLHWCDRDESERLEVHNGTKGARDPFIVKDEECNKYYLIATDLNIASGTTWPEAEYNGSLGMHVWESNDLINFSNERIVYPFKMKDATSEWGCLWAPESIYIKEKKCFFVFFAVMSSLQEGEAKQRIYGCFTNDFKEFTKPKIYMEDENHLIDLTIAYDGKYYHRFIKDETKKYIRHDYVENIEDTQSVVVKDTVLNELTGVEGPEIFQLDDGKWCLIVDRFASSQGYVPLVSDSLVNSKFRIMNEGEYDFDRMKKRHGGVIVV